MSLSDVAAAWALACQDTVCWESCPRVGVDAFAGRIVPLPGGGGDGEGRGTGAALGNGGYDRYAVGAGELMMRYFSSLVCVLCI